MLSLFLSLWFMCLRGQATRLLHEPDWLTLNLLFLVFVQVLTRFIVSLLILPSQPVRAAFTPFAHTLCARLQTSHDALLSAHCLHPSLPSVTCPLFLLVSAFFLPLSLRRREVVPRGDDWLWWRRCYVTLAATPSRALKVTRSRT